MVRFGLDLGKLENLENLHTNTVLKNFGYQLESSSCSHLDLGSQPLLKTKKNITLIAI